MRLRIQLCCLSAIAVLLSCSALHAVRIATDGSQISGIQLVTAQFGWVLANGKLLGTTDGGTSWTDITPTVLPTEYIASIFFLDSQHGWAITSREKKDGRGENGFQVVTTDDGGATWRRHPTSLACPLCTQDSFVADLIFLDAQRGWVLLDVGGNLRSGVLFATADGGRTWEKLSSPWSGKLRFINRNDGWLVSSEMTGAPPELYATRDGGHSWRKRSFEPPPGVGKNTSIAFDPPAFTSPNTGSLAVRFEPEAASEHQRSVVALYNSDDGGIHWTIQRVSPEVDGWGPAPAVARGHAIWAYMRDSHLVIVHDQVAGSPSQESHPLAEPVELLFADAQHGWILLQGGRCRGFKCDCYQQSTLVVTSDGGTTFTVAQLGIGPPKMIAPCRE